MTLERPSLSRWVKLAATGGIPEGETTGVVIEGRSIGLYNVRGKIHATEDICPHARVRLSDGRFDGRTIECPIHAARFDVVTGRRLSGPLCRDLFVYPIKIEEDAIYVDLERIPITRAL